MSSFKTLTAGPREKLKTGASRAVRNQGNVPAIIYGGKQGQQPQAIQVDSKSLNKECESAKFFTTVFELELEGKKHKVLGQAIQFDPVTDLPIHVDFKRIEEGTPVKVLVPINIINHENSPVIKRGGKLNTVKYKLQVECQYDNIPECFEIDLSKHEKSVSITAQDLLQGTTGVKVAKSSEAEAVIATITAKSEAA